MINLNPTTKVIHPIDDTYVSTELTVNIPKELWLHIFSNLSIRSIRCLSLLSKGFYRITIYSNLCELFMKKCFRFENNNLPLKEDITKDCWLICKTVFNDRYLSAKKSAAQDGEWTSRYIEKYGIKDEALLAEIAKIAAAQSGVWTSYYIKNYGIKDEALLAEIAAMQNGVRTSL